MNTVASPPRKTGPRRQKPAESSRLGRDDWLDAAYAAVVEGGFDKVRVLVIADALGVTRGSFYWHFSDHADLLQALLARWQAHELATDRQLQAEATDDPAADLQHLLAAALANAGPDLENIRFELALRGLGRRDPAIASMLAGVDAARMALFEQKFRRLTGDAGKAAELAAMFYLAIAGAFQALGRPVNPPQLRDYLASLISRYLIHQQVPGHTPR